MLCEYPGCEVEFVPRVGGRPQRFCSPGHSGGAKKQRYWEKNGERILAERKLRRAPREERVCACPGCPNTFLTVNRRDQKFCSEKCRTKVHRSTEKYKAKAARSQARRNKLPARQIYIRTWRRRGMSDEAYSAMLAAQDGKCAICLLSDDDLQLDHCHKSGDNRALLCRPCNLGLGHFKDNIDTLTAAVIYLQKHRQRT